MDSVFGVPFAHSIRMLLKSIVNLFFDKIDAVVVEHHGEIAGKGEKCASKYF